MAEDHEKANFSQAVEDFEWHDTGQIGAFYVHTFYPAFLDIPTNSCFIVAVEGRPIYVNIVRHVKALEVTDFDNSLSQAEAESKVYPSILKPILGVDIDSISASARDAWGGEGIVIAAEKSINGKLFRNCTFTEIIIGWEVRKKSEIGGLTLYTKALQRFLHAYRFFTPDLRAKISPSTKIGGTAIRTGFVEYVGYREANALDRLRDHKPLKWHLDTLSIGDFIGGVAGPSEKFGEASERSNAIGSYLYHGFVLPESLIGLEVTMENSYWSGNYRLCVVEVMSIAEMVLLSAWKRFSKHVKIGEKIENPNGHGWKFLSTKLLPIIIGFYDGEKGPILKQFGDAVNIRHKVVHSRYRPTAEEGDLVASSVRAVLNIIELPNRYKGDWKLRPGYPDAVGEIA